MFCLFYQNKPLKENIVGLLIISMLFTGGVWAFFQPKPVQAITVVEVASVPAQTIQDFAKWLWEKAAEAYHSAASWISARIDAWKLSDTFLKRAAVAALDIVLRMVLAMITNEIIKWIQGGGEPRFINDWKGFLKDIADKAGGIFVDKYLGMGFLCEGFDIDIKIALLDVPKFDDRVKCTISDIVDNISDFSNDFSKGSWKGWITLTEPRNNFYGGYLMAREEKLMIEEEAREAAALEAQAGKGFWSPRVCVKGYVGETGETCSGKDDCDGLKGETSFVCENDVSTTPGATISDITSKAVTQELTILENQIGDLADSTGPYLKPYITAIANALVNRALKEGLSFVQGLGPDADNPNRPLPGGTTVGDVDTTPEGAVSGQGEASSLVEQQELLKENLETQLLKEQRLNLSILENILDTQEETLDVLVQIIKENDCPLPYFASSEIIDTNEIDNETIEYTIRISSTDVGTATIKKRVFDDDREIIITYHSQENHPQIEPEYVAMGNEIDLTNQWVGQVAESIRATNGYNQAAQEYLDLYQRTLQPPTEEEQAALDIKKQLMDAAERLAIEKGEIAIKVEAGTITTLDVLNTETQAKSIDTIQEITSLITARGMAAYPQPGTYYGKRADALSKRSAAMAAKDCDSR